MKRLIIILLGLIFVTPVFAQQQRVQRRTKSPYLFPTFFEAKVTQPFGRYTTGKINVRLRDAALCFLEGDTIKEAFVNNILGFQTDSLFFRKVNNQMGRVVAQENYNFLVCVTTIDAELYGKEITDLNTLQNMAGGTDGPFNIDTRYAVDELEENVAEGYPLKDTYYFIVKGQPVRAIQSKVKKVIHPDKKKLFKTIVENDFWSWEDPESLKKLFDLFP